MPAHNFAVAAPTVCGIHIGCEHIVRAVLRAENIRITRMTRCRITGAGVRNTVNLRIGFGCGLIDESSVAV